MNVVDQDIRLHFRIHSGRSEDSARAIDMSIPNSASLHEVLAEVLELAHAPSISVPWQMTTAAGVELDTNIAIAQTDLEHGSIVMLRPRRPTPVPVLRDSAEAVSALGGHLTAVRWTALAASFSGAIGCCALLLLSPTPLPLAASLGIAGLMLLAAYVFAPNALLLPMIVAFVAFSSAIVVTGGRAHDAVLGVLAGVCSGFIAVLLCWFIACRRSPATTLEAKQGWHVTPVMRRSITACATVLLLFMAGTPAGWMYQRYESAPHGWWVGASALGTLAAVVLGITAPLLAAKLGGLSVPHVPTAGEDLATEDQDTAPDVLQAQAQAARVFFDGIHLGILSFCVPAFAWLALSSSPAIAFNAHPISTACLGAAVSLAMILHAHRHQSPTTVWCTWLVGMAALLSLAIAGANSGHWAVLVLAGIMCGAAALAPAWSNRLRALSPTTVVWLERFETASVCLAVPLTLQVLGLFGMLRGYAG
ncbi:type VII secretion integral membrane protein EccD [Corynebacterium gerontici]|uniref:EccD-like transmembrane domain-containing protein n=1 Tax=Corynebacterium gerontici TaxID=2079234 RepID=A0A3G6J2W7_9CORY|nr:type VII secretion integral membrane protein EccD [Corynebacterium gerontici]AZA12053.1 hypothetical protein CGERO_08810 [Corynebacterium gerontici]